MNNCPLLTAHSSLIHLFLLYLSISCSPVSYLSLTSILSISCSPISYLSLPSILSISYSPISYSLLICHLFIYLIFITYLSPIHPSHIHYLSTTYSSISYSLLICHLFTYLLFITYQSLIHPASIRHRDGRQNTAMRRHCAPAGEAQPPRGGILPACRRFSGQNRGRIRIGDRPAIGERFAIGDRPAIR
jgi:hypothetical protein